VDPDLVPHLPIEAQMPRPRLLRMKDLQQEATKGRMGDEEHNGSEGLRWGVGSP
jgi:hypothetical protein